MAGSSPPRGARPPVRGEGVVYVVKEVKEVKVVRVVKGERREGMKERVVMGSGRLERSPIRAPELGVREAAELSLAMAWPPAHQLK